MTAVTMKMRARCGCDTCMFELAQATFAHLVDQAGGFIQVPLDALDKMEKEGTEALSAELTKDGQVMVRSYSLAEAVKEIARRG